jgi:alpha-tubulin suppressor-like RCC1 family protein
VTKTDSTVACWGYRWGNSTVPFAPPRPVQHLTDAVEIATTSSSACARKSDGTVWCWGTGYLGDGEYHTDDIDAEPHQVSGLSDVTRLASSAWLVCALRADETVWCWGATQSCNFLERSGDCWEHYVPKKLNYSGRIQSISLGDFDLTVACFINTDSDVWCFKMGAWAPIATGFSDVSVGDDQVCAIAIDTTVWCRGLGSGGGLGNGTEDDSASFVQTTNLNDARAISSGGSHTCAIQSDSTLWCWGSGYAAGLGTDGDHFIPQQVTQYSQNIALAPIDDRTMSQPRTFEVSPLSTSELLVTISAEGTCTSHGNEVTVIAAGSCSITASQPGNDWYLPTETVQTFDILKSDQTILFAPIPDRTVDMARSFDITPAPSSTSGLSVELEAAGQCDISGVRVTVLERGLCAITTTQVGDETFNPAEPITKQFAIAGRPQTITLPTIKDKLITDKPFGIRARATSGLPVTITSLTEDVCGVDEETDLVELWAAGECALVAHQTGNSMYEPANEATTDFWVSGVLLSNKKLRFIAFETGSPIAGVTVTWQTPDGTVRSRASVKTDRNGYATWKKIPAGAVNFRLRGAVQVGEWITDDLTIEGWVGTNTRDLVSYEGYGDGDAIFRPTVSVGMQQFPDDVPLWLPVVGASVSLDRPDSIFTPDFLFCRPKDDLRWRLQGCRYSGLTDYRGDVALKIVAPERSMSSQEGDLSLMADVVFDDGDIEYHTSSEIAEDDPNPVVLTPEPLPVVELLNEDASVGFATKQTVIGRAVDAAGEPVAGAFLTLKASVRGAVGNTCKATLAGKTNAYGIIRFSFCPIKTAVWSADGKSRVASRGVVLAVRRTPSAPRSAMAYSVVRGISLSWRAPAEINVGKVTDYIVQYRLVGASSWTTFKDGISASLKATVTKLTAGQAYEFRIAAKNSAGQGNWSDVVTATWR